MSKIIIEDDGYTNAKEYTNLSTEVIESITTLLNEIVDSPYNDSESNWTYELSSD